MYVKTSISEMELDSVKVGGTIKCVSSDTGDEYTAEVKEFLIFLQQTVVMAEMHLIQTVPYYPIVAFIKDADGLSPEAVLKFLTVRKSMGTANENAVYLQKAYIQTEDKKSYMCILEIRRQNA